MPRAKTRVFDDRIYRHVGTYGDIFALRRDASDFKRIGWLIRTVRTRRGYELYVHHGEKKPGMLETIERHVRTVKRIKGILER